jgi:outer membrane protein assembly factor BamB
MGIAALAGLAADRAAGQPKAAAISSIRLTEAPRDRQVIDVARDLIKDEVWGDAVKMLQTVLNEKEDRFLRVAQPDPANPKKEITRWRGMKAEANDLIGVLPGKGLQVYEATYGADAREMLEKALKLKDSTKIAEVALRYRHTKAGIEAVSILAKSAFPELPKPDGWPSWRGNASNSAQASGNPPLFAKKLWSRPVMLDKLEGLPEVDPDQPAMMRVVAAVKQMRDLKQPVLPGFFPIASQGIMVYRTQRDVRAVTLKKIRIVDPQTGEGIETLAGEIQWKAIPLRRSLSVLLEKNATRGKTDLWLDVYATVPGLSSILYENTLIGTLATDGRNVYLIDDLSVPPNPKMFQPLAFKNPQLNPGELKPLLLQNELAAYNLLTGKLMWDLNGWDEQFKDSHFLSVPISIDGKLYVLNERLLNPNENVKPNPFGGGGNLIGGDSELRLICIDPSKMAANKPDIVATVALGKVVEPDRMVQDLRRRVQAAPLAYADGILVCPTNAGEVFGIELPARSLAWAYSYRESAPEPIALPGLELPQGQKGTTVVSKWKSAPPAIQDGKLVFTAPDSDSIHCVSLRDGKPVWNAGHQKDDLYLAGVYAGRVLIVGATRIRALDLKDGRQLWAIATDDLPAGQRTATKDLYYLPLQKEILVVDFVKGEIKAHHPVPAGASLGNLVFYGDMVLSQTPTEVTAYPQSRTKRP